MLFSSYDDLYFEVLFRGYRITRRIFSLLISFLQSTITYYRTPNDTRCNF